jgi:hypothetical protein
MRYKPYNSEELNKYKSLKRYIKSYKMLMTYFPMSMSTSDSMTVNLALECSEYAILRRDIDKIDECLELFEMLDDSTSISISTDISFYRKVTVAYGREKNQQFKGDGKKRNRERTRNRKKNIDA